MFLFKIKVGVLPEQNNRVKQYFLILFCNKFHGSKRRAFRDVKVDVENSQQLINGGCRNIN